MKKTLIEGEDFYYNENGYMVLTEDYLLDRGFCCGNGCKHCPYNFINVIEPLRSELIKIKGFKKESNSLDT